MLEEFLPFIGLIIFGNIENLILASQGASAHVEPFILSIFSFIAVICWFLLGTYGTKMAIIVINQTFIIDYSHI